MVAKLFRHLIRLALALLRPKVGISSAANIAIMPVATSISVMEKPRWRGRDLVFGDTRTACPRNLARFAKPRKCPGVDISQTPREQSPAMPENALTIRPATETDVPLLLDFIRAIAEYEKLLPEVTATEDNLRQSLFGPRPVAEGLLAEWAGQPAGYAIFFHNFSSFTGRPGLYLEDLFVKPEFRQRGIGQKLLAHLAALAHERNCPRFEWVALDWNQTAIDFYENLGAHQMAEWRLFRMTPEPIAKLAGQ